MKKKQWFHPQMFTLNVHIYKVDVVVSINMSGAQTYERFKRWKVTGTTLKNIKEICDKWDEENELLDGRMCEVAGGFLVLLKMKKTKFRESVGTLTHEMTHVTHYLLRNRRIPLTEDTEEAHTYLVQYLVTSALNEMY